MDEHLEGCPDCELLDMLELEYEVIINGCGFHIQHIILEEGEAFQTDPRTLELWYKGKPEAPRDGGEDVVLD